MTDPKEIIRLIAHELRPILLALSALGVLRGLLIITVLVIVRQEFRFQRTTLVDVNDQQTAMRYIICASPGLDTMSLDWKRLKCSTLQGLVRRPRPATRNEP